ncbi:MAG: hypothetical protein ACD_75C00115G0002 [uncultured bacterium]|nr:MAG: hypothetical protein ACD_75C00115G0002 [uncultured bacterium]
MPIPASRRLRKAQSATASSLTPSSSPSLMARVSICSPCGMRTASWACRVSLMFFSTAAMIDSRSTAAARSRLR